MDLKEFNKWFQDNSSWVISLVLGLSASPLINRLVTKYFPTSVEKTEGTGNIVSAANEAVDTMKKVMDQMEVRYNSEISMLNDRINKLDEKVRMESATRVKCEALLKKIARKYKIKY